MRISAAFLTLSLLLALGRPVLPAAEASGGTTLKLDQTCQGLGHMVSYISPQAFRVERGVLVVVAHGPEWKVYSFNTDRKIYLDQTFEKGLRSVTLFGPASASFVESDLKWKKGDNGVVAGLPALLWRSDPVYASPGEAAHKASKIRHWVYCDKSISNRSARYLSSLYGLPFLGDGLPLRTSFFGKISTVLPIASRATITDDPMGDHFWLDIKSAAKVSVPDSLFEVPKGFKPTTDLTSLYLGQKVSKSNDIIQDLLKNPDALFQAR